MQFQCLKKGDLLFLVQVGCLYSCLLHDILKYDNYLSLFFCAGQPVAGGRLFQAEQSFICGRLSIAEAVFLANFAGFCKTNVKSVAI